MSQEHAYEISKDEINKGKVKDISIKPVNVKESYIKQVTIVILGIHIHVAKSYIVNH